MNNTEELDKANTASRRKFIWNAGKVSIMAAFAAVAGIRLSPVKKNIGINNAPGKKSIMLTDDGQLVEIDQNVIAVSSKKITNKELQNWIKK